MIRPFVKYVGCGNDFVLFDNRQDYFPVHHKSLIQKLCHRQWGIGADGIILLEKSTKADIRMRIFNSDGSEAAMCGNGIRCLVQWVDLINPSPTKSYTVETRHGIHAAAIKGAEICIEMGNPTHLEWNIPLLYQDQKLLFHSLSTGVPHAVLFDEVIDSFDLDKLGPLIRHHPRWQPQGTNVTLAQKLDAHHFKIRTFERGVEGETLACGTGATAVALCAAYHYDAPSPVTIQMAAGSLKIGFQHYQDQFSDVTMTGPAVFSFKGEIEIKDKSKN